MSEPVQLAKAAREQLAAALNALQTADVPDELVDAAEPVAQAMGVLHRIERTNGANLDGRDTALDAVRTALGRVQKVEANHPAVERVMEAIALSLSKVHALARYAPPAPAPAPAPAPVAAPQYAPPPQPVLSPGGTLPLNQAIPVADPAAPPAYARPTPPVISPQYAQPTPAPAAPPAAAQQQTFQDPFKAVPMAAAAPRAADPVAATMASAQPQGHAAKPAGRSAPADRPSQSGGSGKVDVELGIHSASNFYKGLGGNDVIEHGGIFVATYKVLKINTPVTLKVLLPGDYEFTASAVVQWTREGGSSEPGYGARFTQITPEGRQLVYRYTRNREPMFYDDL